MKTVQTYEKCVWMVFNPFPKTFSIRAFQFTLEAVKGTDMYGRCCIKGEGLHRDQIGLALSLISAISAASVIASCRI